MGSPLEAGGGVQEVLGEVIGVETVGRIAEEGAILEK